MKKLLKAGLLAALVLSLLIAVGCDEDDEGATGSTDKQVGDLNNPEFLQVQAALEDADEFSGLMFEAVLFAIDTILFEAGQGSSGRTYPGKHLTSTEADSVLLTYHETSQYWYLYSSSQITAGDDTLTMVTTDSIQFLHLDGPVQWPDSSLLIGVNNGVYLSMMSSGGEHIIAGQLLTVMGEILTDGDITMNGNQVFDVLLANDVDSCSLDLNLTTTATNVVLNIEHVDSSGCPSSGVLQQHGTIAIACTGTPSVSYSDTWTITQTFTGDDMYTVVAENSTTRWTYSGSCRDE